MMNNLWIFILFLVSTRKYSVLHKGNEQNSAKSKKEEEIEEDNENTTHLAYVAIPTAEFPDSSLVYI